LLIKNSAQQQEALLPLPLNFVFKHTTWKVQTNQEGFNVTYQLLVYADYVHLMGENHGQLIHKDCRAAALPEILRNIKINI
jgi:hypothetical protein